MSKIRQTRSEMRSRDIITVHLLFAICLAKENLDENSDSDIGLVDVFHHSWSPKSYKKGTEMYQKFMKSIADGHPSGFYSYGIFRNQKTGKIFTMEMFGDYFINSPPIAHSNKIHFVRMSETNRGPRYYKSLVSALADVANVKS